MRSETVHFEEVKYQASKSLPCPSCGKKVRRSRTFMQTISPFNKNADGQPKTREQIHVELHERAQEWQQEAVLCTPCENAPLRSDSYLAELRDVAEDRGDDTGPLATVERIDSALDYLDQVIYDEPQLIDPDCRDGKCGSCVGGLCEHECHTEEGPRP